jgi:hypothetical protein
MPSCRGFMEVSDGTRTRGRRDHNPGPLRRYDGCLAGASESSVTLSFKRHSRGADLEVAGSGRATAHTLRWPASRSATHRLRDTLRDTRRGVKYGPNRPAAGQEMALQCGPAPSDGLTGNVEGLVRDNRVEVRVLFGASQKAPLRRGFRRSRPTPFRGAQHSVTTPLATGEQLVFPSVPHNWEAAMSVHYERTPFMR